MTRPRLYARGLGVALAALVSSAAPAIHAAPTAGAPATTGSLRATAPAGGGEKALEVVIDPDARVVRVKKCATTACTAAAGGYDVPIPIAADRIDRAASTAKVIPIGQGKFVVHVRVPDAQRHDLAFEAVVSAHGGEPVFAGLTGYTHGSDLDRSGQVVRVYDRDQRSRFVIVADVREDTRICGQELTPLRARGLDPKSMKLVGATLHRIDKKTRDAAERVVAEVDDAPKAPLARLLVATGGSAPGGAALTDGDAATTWSEARPGDGHGEFVTMQAPHEVPIRALRLTVAPPAPSDEKTAEGAAPRTLFLATDARVIQVTLPEDAWQKPGRSYDVKLTEPLETTCVAVVLDRAYDHGKRASQVGLAEVSALTAFDLDGASLDDVVSALSTERGDEAAAVLRRAGDPGLAAVVARFDALEPRARAFAIDVASSTGSCDGPAAALLTRALSDRDAEVRRRALGRIERCGKRAAPALAQAVKGEDEVARAAAAPLLATVAGSIALETLPGVMGEGAPATRKAVRSAFARAAARATPDALSGILAASRARSPRARIDLLRAMGPRLAEVRHEADVAIAELLQGSPPMATRYLLVAPLVALARTKDATAGELTRLADLAKRDREWPVRARAVELSAGVAPLAATVIAGAADPAPRVREAALHAIGVSSLAAGADAARAALSRDEWTFVRTAAGEALARLPASPATASALGEALADKSARVRMAALAALGKQRATSQAEAVRDRLDDTDEAPGVRALAAMTLGAMCVGDAADRLTDLAKLARRPMDEADERIGLAAIRALGMLHPHDVAERLAPLRDPGVRGPVRRAAALAIAGPGACR